MTLTQEKKNQSEETDSWLCPDVELADKDFKAAIINIFKKVKENVVSVNKPAILADNTNYTKKLMEILKLRTTVAEIKICQIASTATGDVKRKMQWSWTQINSNC